MVKFRPKNEISSKKNQILCKNGEISSNTVRFQAKKKQSNLDQKVKFQAKINKFCAKVVKFQAIKTKFKAKVGQISSYNRAILKQ